jgi:hypothetical protein
MERRRVWDRTAVWLLLTAIVLLRADRAQGGCDAPGYRIGRVLADNASGVDLTISLQLQDFAPRRLVCLAGALKKRYPGRNVSAAIFSSHEAAVGWTPSTEWTPSLFAYQLKLHGFYSYNKEKSDEYLSIAPDASSQEADSPFDTLIVLPLRGAPVCKLAVSGRCLLEFRHIAYPSVEGRADSEGSVTLAGQIRRDGIVSDVAVVDAKVDAPERRSALVASAMENLGTWRFEPGKQRDDLRLTYEFGRADPTKTLHGTVMEFRLPDEVRVGH